MRKTKNDAELLKIQGERLKAVLKDLHLSQADVVRALKDKVAIDPQRMSDYVNGKRPLTEVVLSALKMRFFINKEYLTGKSENMYDIPETILNYAYGFVDQITIIENPDSKIKSSTGELQNEKYLYLTMEKAFYDFLLNLGLFENLEEKGTFDTEKVMAELKDQYRNSRTEKELEEYVLLPKNVLYEILTNDKKASQKRTKVIQEVIDFEQLSESIPKCVVQKKLKLKKNSDK